MRRQAIEVVIDELTHCLIHRESGEEILVDRYFGKGEGE